MFEDKGDILSKDILTEKFRLIEEGKNPRLVLVNKEEYDLLEENWVQTLKELPWGDTILYELEQRKKHSGDVFLADGTIHGLWLVKVEIERFKVY